MEVNGFHQEVYESDEEFKHRVMEKLMDLEIRLHTLEEGFLRKAKMMQNLADEIEYNNE